MYEELVKQLRNRRVCVQYGGDLGQDYPLMREAADAIEELLAWHNADAREIERQKSLIADVRPVVRGHWIKTAALAPFEDDKFECSVCGSWPWWCGVTDANLPNFCPNCGCSMVSEDG